MTLHRGVNIRETEQYKHEGKNMFTFSGSPWAFETIRDTMAYIDSKLNSNGAIVSERQGLLMI